MVDKLDMTKVWVVIDVKHHPSLLNRLFKRHSCLVLGQFEKKEDAFALFDLLRKGGMTMKIDIYNGPSTSCDDEYFHKEGVMESNPPIFEPTKNFFRKIIFKLTHH